MASYRYDALDRRIEKTVDGAITVFLHAGAEEIAEYDSSGNLLRRFVPGAGFGEIIATVEASPSGGGLRYFHHDDGLGSTVARSNDAGWITEINAYGPFGEGSAPHGTNAFGFTGQRFDAESGLYYFRARYYSPTLGRFLQPDPAGFVDGLNLYTYAGNSPITFNDPLGLASNPNSGGGSFDLLKTAGQEFGAAAKSAIPFYDAYNAFQQGSIATGVVLAAVEVSPAKLVKTLFKFGRAAVRTIQAARKTRVGRWMGQAEHEAMLTTGRVQESSLQGVTSVTAPPNAGAWVQQTTGSRFVEFDVPKSAVRAQDGVTGKIYGPNSIFGPKLGITRMPRATNIKQTASRIPRTD